MALAERPTQGYDPASGPAGSMGPPGATMRCPACGTELRAVLAPTPPTQWFPCPRCHTPVPFLAPRELPPLYAWEVTPGLYPLLPVPHRPRWPWRSVACLALAAAAVLAGVATGVLAEDGYASAQPSTYTVSGTVFVEHPGGTATPLSGATVVLWTDDNRSRLTNHTNGLGEFLFRNDVPNGGVELNITDLCCPPTVVYLFASRSYSTATSGIDVTLSSTSANASAYALTPFPDLETFLAYVGGAAVLFGVATAVAAFATIAVRHQGGAVVGVLGGGASVALPAVVVLFSLGDALPIVTALAGAVGGAGAFVLVLCAADLASGGAGRDGSVA